MVIYIHNIYIYIYYEGTRIHGSFGRKNRHHFCAQNFAASPHFIPKIIAAPASMLITMAGTAPGRILLWPGPHRDSSELCRIAAFYSKDHCSARKHAHYYGRDRAGTHFTMAGTAPGLITMAGTAPGRADTLITMAGTALRRSLLWPGPRRDAVYYGRDRTGGRMDGVFHICKLLSFILSQSHNIVSQACAQKVFHYAFCMYALSARVANVLMMQGIYHKPGTRPIWTGRTSNFLVHGEHARTC